MIEFALPLLVIAFGCYLASRFSMLAGWGPVTGSLRLLGLWAAAAWVGYSTPLYVAVLCLPLGLVWAKFESRWIMLIAFELLFAAAIVWFSKTPPVIIFLLALVLFDQIAARLLLSNYKSQLEPRRRLHQFLIFAGVICCGLFIQRYHWHSIEGFATSHSPLQIANLQPESAATPWFHKRTLRGTAAGQAQPGSVYWQSRYPETGERCAISFHGAASPASLQSAPRTMGRAARHAGLRLFAVDHPGFGASPPPSSDASADTWNPEHLTSSVLKQMQLSGCKDTLVIGHSQGVTEALRLFTERAPDISSVLVFGGGLYLEDKEREEYWHGRFHSDRGIANSDRISRENWKLIRDLYYLNQEYCADTESGKSYQASLNQPNDDYSKSLHFVQFEREHDNLVATRNQLFKCLAYPDVELHTLPTDHYLDSLQIGSMVFVQRSSPELVSALLPKSTTGVDNPAIEVALDES